MKELRPGMTQPLMALEQIRFAQSGVRLPVFASLLHHLSVGKSGVSVLALLCFSFLTCETMIIVLSLKGFLSILKEYMYVKALSTGPGMQDS